MLPRKETIKNLFKDKSLLLFMAVLFLALSIFAAGGNGKYQAVPSERGKFYVLDTSTGKIVRFCSRRWPQYRAPEKQTKTDTAPSASGNDAQITLRDIRRENELENADELNRLEKMANSPTYKIRVWLEKPHIWNFHPDDWDSDDSHHLVCMKAITPL